MTTVDPHADQSTFFDPAQLLDDTARLNLLRRCEIHCVGVGAVEAAPGSAASEQQTRLGALLERLVSLGHGRYRAIPTPTAERARAAEALPPRMR